MKAVTAATAASRAWAVTPAGAYALLRTTRHPSESVYPKSRQLHSTPLRYNEATTSSTRHMEHRPLPIPIQASTNIGTSTRTTGPMSRRARKIARAQARYAAREAVLRAVDTVEPQGEVEAAAGPASASIMPLMAGVFPPWKSLATAPPTPPTDTTSAGVNDPVDQAKREKRTARQRARRARVAERKRRGSALPASVSTGSKSDDTGELEAAAQVGNIQAKDAESANQSDGAPAATTKEVKEPANRVRDPPPHVSSISPTSPSRTEQFRAVRSTAKETIIQEGSISPTDIILQEVKPDRPMKIATLRSDLSRVLFSPGVHHLRDPRCGVRNFGKGLDAIPKAEEFAMERTPTYVPPSQHQELLDLASKSQTKFIGSTSTLTKAFSQIWFTINGGRELNFSKFSQDFADANKTYTHGAELPAVLVLTPLASDNSVGFERVWAVDSDKAYDIENALSDYGRVLEKQLTAEDDDFRRFLRSSPSSAVSQAERSEAEAYRYRKAGSILMRSQLDCHDPRLPGTGVFDIKTRACHPLRHDRANVQQGSGHDVYLERGMGNTFERELYDLVRSAMLKFSMQIRIGDMDGIFLAYHNTARMFGFQYLPLSEIDEYLFGSSELADQAFNLSISIFERIIQHVTETIGGDEPISMMMYKTPRTRGPLNVYFGPANQHSPTHVLRLRTSNSVDGQPLDGGITFGDKPRGSEWTIKYTLSTVPIAEAESGFTSCVNMLKAMCTLSVPDGKTVGEMNQLEELKKRGGEGDGLVEEELLDSEVTGNTRAQVQGSGDAEVPDSAETSSSAKAQGHGRSKVKVKWVQPNGRIQALRREVDASKALYEERKKGWIV